MLGTVQQGSCVGYSPAGYLCWVQSSRVAVLGTVQQGSCVGYSPAV